MQIKYSKSALKFLSKLDNKPVDSTCTAIDWNNLSQYSE